jgi:hypothetical protein
MTFSPPDYRLSERIVTSNAEITDISREQLRPSFLCWPFDTWDAAGEYLLRSEGATHRQTFPQAILQMSCTGPWLCRLLRIKEEES